MFGQLRNNSSALIKKRFCSNKNNSVTSNPRDPPIMQCQFGANFLSMVCEAARESIDAAMIDRHFTSTKRVQIVVLQMILVIINCFKRHARDFLRLASLIILAATSNFPGNFSQAATTTCRDVRMSFNFKE